MFDLPYLMLSRINQPFSAASCLRGGRPFRRFQFLFVSIHLTFLFWLVIFV
ncbi:hypothetical protein RV03_GL003321 [Enterococcus gallinarum]|nr:hypothetical protein RV03_GL003321 [Enterococcus gallinarum]